MNATATAYSVHGTSLLHVTTGQPQPTRCGVHPRYLTDNAIEIEAQTTGTDNHKALLNLSDTLFERGTQPSRLCGNCAGLIRWWLGGTS